MCVDACLHVYVHMYMCACVCTYMCIYMYMCVYIYITWGIADIIIGLCNVLYAVYDSICCL